MVKDRGFASGYREKPARKSEWKDLLQGYFTSGNAICALNEQVAAVRNDKKVEGDFSKRKSGYRHPRNPFPIKRTGESWMDENLSFTSRSDRVAACKWYVDYAEKLFANAKLHNLETHRFLLVS